MTGDSVTCGFIAAGSRSSPPPDQLIAIVKRKNEGNGDVDVLIKAAINLHSTLIDNSAAV